VIIGIVVALPEEVSTLTRAKPAQGDCVAISEKILLCFAGAGPINAERATQNLINQGATHLISWGCAAALSPDLKPGHLVLASGIKSDNQHFNSDADWIKHLHQLLSPSLSLSAANLAASKQLVASSQEKQQIFQQTGAIALDMESGAIAELAQTNGLAFVAIRAIADPASMNLPNAIAHSLNDNGQVVLTRLLTYLISHPWEIPCLIKLGLHFNAAQKTLKTVALQLNAFVNF
jgi:adenosylhomocysteine nucleosidase